MALDETDNRQEPCHGGIYLEKVLNAHELTCHCHLCRQKTSRSDYPADEYSRDFVNHSDAFSDKFSEAPGL